MSSHDPRPRVYCCCSVTWLLDSVPGAGAHVKTHEPEGFSALLKRLVNFSVGLADQSAERALKELLLRVGPPSLGHRAIAATHIRLKRTVSHLLGQVVRETHLQAPVNEADSSEAELQSQVVVKLDHVADRQEDRPQSVLNHVFAQLAGGRDGHRVGVDHAESLLVDRVLALGSVDRVLAPEASQEGLKLRLNHEAGSIFTRRFVN